jgi:hypothetical protein
MSNLLIDNKSIAIVGNAESLFKYNFGIEIDKHDTVIRINRSASICFGNKYRSIQKTHGTKTTIWVFSFADTMKSAIQKNYDKANHLIQMNPSSKNRIEYSFDFECISADDILKLKEKLNKLNDKSELHYAPSTGLRTLDYVSKFSPKEVNVYGFDWKKTPTFYDIKKETQQHEVRHNHNYFLEMKYCKEVFQPLFKFNGV